MTVIRTRFAPSPTGFLHIGGARTALFNFLFARHHGGQFVLRIEDTDRERSRPEYTQAILDSLAWLGIDYDQGPFMQSERAAFHKECAERMVSGGHAYHCICSATARVAEATAAQQQGRRAVYDRTCRDAGHRPQPGRPSVVRLRAPTDGETVIEDLVRGRVSFDNAELDDLVLVRSDGTPTFHLAVVADDMDMGITHVLRGEDHLSNTPKQVHIVHGLGGEPPIYGHMPLIVGKDRARLSKRHGATSVEAYREQGLLPEALLNYLARLGWSHGDRELFARQDLIELFDINSVGKAAGAFDTEKLAWVNFEHQRLLSDADLASAVVPYLEQAGLARPSDEGSLIRAVALYRERSKNLLELGAAMRPLLSDAIEFEAKAVKKFLGEDALVRLADIEQRLVAVSDWEQTSIEQAFTASREHLDVGLGKLAQPVRVALTGGTVSPGIFELCAVLGQKRTLARLAAARQGAAAGTLPMRAVAS